VFAHEATEIVTNFDHAWYDPMWEENADKCNWQFGPVLNNDRNNANSVVGNRTWFLQMNWVPNYGCRMSLPLTSNNRN
jgi:beta-glucosidase-like glycosyl hydrolase